MHPEATRSDGWGGDSTARTLAGLNLGEASGYDMIGQYQGEGHGDGHWSVYIKGDIGVGV